MKSQKSALAWLFVGKAGASRAETEMKLDDPSLALYRRREKNQFNTVPSFGFFLPPLEAA